jgi:serine/threonine-protein kinase
MLGKSRPALEFPGPNPAGDEASAKRPREHPEKQERGETPGQFTSFSFYGIFGQRGASGMPWNRVLFYLQILLIFLAVFFLSATLASRFIQRGDFVSVPDLAGKTMAEAGSELAGKRLALQQSGTVFSDRFERDRIILQDPPAGSRIRVNRNIRVVVSGGSEMIEVPQLAGRSLEAAVKILAEIGLQKGLISQIHTPRYAAGRVIAQEPEPGSPPVRRNSAVDLLVSQGELESKYVMPDLIERPAAPTISKLNGLGFRVADIRYSYYPGHDPGIIINQFPRAGYSVSKRSLISLEVSR